MSLYIFTPLGRSDLTNFHRPMFFQDDEGKEGEEQEIIQIGDEHIEFLREDEAKVINNGGFFLVKIQTDENKEEFMERFDGDYVRLNFELWKAFPKEFGKYLGYIDFPEEYFPDDSPYWEDEESLDPPMDIFDGASIVKHWEWRNFDGQEIPDYDEIFAEQDKRGDTEPVEVVTLEDLRKVFPNYPADR